MRFCPGQTHGGKLTPHVSERGRGVCQVVYRCMDVLRNVTGFQYAIKQDFRVKSVLDHIVSVRSTDTVGMGFRPGQ